MFSLTYRQQLDDCVARQQWPQAVELCQRLLKAREEEEGVADLETADLYRMLAKALVRQGDDEGAIAAYLSSLTTQPNHSNSHYALGVLFERSQKNPQALTHYQTALRLSPDWSQAALKVGRLFHRMGDAAQAMSVYQSILDKGSSCSEAHFYLGLLSENSGQYSAAVRAYREAVFAQPNYVMAYRRLGETLMRLQAHDVAIEVYEQAIAACAEDALLHNSLGQALAIEGETERAISAYKKAIELSPDLAIAHQNLGRLSRSAQSAAQATTHFQQAFKLSPNNVSILSDYTWRLIAEERWDDVLDCFRLACEGNSSFVEAYCLQTATLTSDDPLLRSQHIAGRFLSSLSQRAEPLTQARSQELLIQLGTLYQSLGELAVAGDAPFAAERSYRNALSLMPSSLELYGTLGDYLLQQGRSAAAVALYQAGIYQADIYRAGIHQPGILHQQLMPDALTHESPLYDQSGRDQSHLQQRLKAVQESPGLVEHYSENSAASNSVFEVKGVYRRTQDWLAAYSLIESPVEPEASISIDRAESPDANCGGLTCQACMKNLVRKFSPEQVGKGAFACRMPAEDDELSLTPFVAEIPQGRAWIAPQTDDWAVCNEIAVFSPDGFLLGDVSRYYPWYLPGCDRHDIKNHPVLQRQEPLPAVKHLPGKVAVLSGLSGHVYYHWLFDVLPRIGILQQQMALSDVDYFVVNSLEKSFQQETLQALGIPLNQVVASDQLPHFQAESLMVPSFAGYLDWVPPATIEFLRRTFLSSSAFEVGAVNSPSTADVPTGKRLYISRAGAKYRHVFNEEAVLSLLERFGFASVALECLTVAQQVRLFAQAEVIIAPHGSGLSNLVFCSPGTVVVELFSPYYLRTDYWMISQYLQMHHYYMVGESFAFHPLRQLMYPSGLSEDFSIDIAALRSLLRQIGLAP